MNDNLGVRAGKFAAYEILDTSAFGDALSFGNVLTRSKFTARLGLTAAESEFLRKTLEKDRFAIIIVGDSDGKVHFILTALYRIYRVLLTFSPMGDISTADLYSICDLRGTFTVSPRAMDVMSKNAGRSMDFSGRVSRLLNINFYLARGAGQRRNFYDVIDGAVKFAENVSLLSGVKLTLEPDCPEPAFSDHFDCALLGLLLVETIAKSAEISKLSVHLKFITHKESKPFVCISLAGEPELYDLLTVSIMHRINVPIKLVPSEKGTKILVCPLRPDFSVMELKQRLSLLWLKRSDQTDIAFPE